MTDIESNDEYLGPPRPLRRTRIEQYSDAQALIEKVCYRDCDSKQFTLIVIGGSLPENVKRKHSNNNLFAEINEDEAERLLDDAFAFLGSARLILRNPTVELLKAVVAQLPIFLRRCRIDRVTTYFMGHGAGGGFYLRNGSINIVDEVLTNFNDFPTQEYPLQHFHYFDYCRIGEEYSFPTNCLKGDAAVIFSTQPCQIAFAGDEGTLQDVKSGSWASDGVGVFTRQFSNLVMNHVGDFEQFGRELCKRTKEELERLNPELKTDCCRAICHSTNVKRINFKEERENTMKPQGLQVYFKNVGRVATFEVQQPPPLVVHHKYSVQTHRLQMSLNDHDEWTNVGEEFKVLHQSGYFQAFVYKVPIPTEMFGNKVEFRILAKTGYCRIYSDPISLQLPTLVLDGATEDELRDVKESDEHSMQESQESDAHVIQFSLHTEIRREIQVSSPPHKESQESDVLQCSQQRDHSTHHEEDTTHVSSSPQKLFFSSYHEQRDNIPFIDPITVITCDHQGIEHTLVDHDITLTIPPGAIPKGKVVYFEMGVALYGRFNFPNNTRPISPILWLCPQEDIEFNCPIMVTLPHFLNNLNQQELAQLEVAFSKADHNDYSESENSQNALCFNFQPCSIQPQFSYKHQQGFATLETDHCCLICLTSKQCPKFARSAGFLLIRFDYVSIDLTHVVTFCVSFYLKSCLKVLKSQFAAIPLKDTRQQRFNFKPKSGGEDLHEDLEITIRNDHEDKYVGDMSPIDGKIKLLDVDFWRRKCSVETMELEQSENMYGSYMYPPRFRINFIPKGNLKGNCQCRVQVGVTGYISNTNLDNEISLPLVSCATSLSDSATQQTARSPIEKDWVEVVHYLKPLDENQTKELGGWLGLSASNLDKMKDLPYELVKAWFRKQDSVLEKSGPILTWETLAQKLVKMKQYGIAETILEEKCGKSLSDLL